MARFCTCHSFEISQKTVFKSTNARAPASKMPSKIAREELENTRRKYKLHYDRSTKRRTYSAGDELLISLPAESNKLLMIKMERTFLNSDHKINVDGKVKIYNVNLLKRFGQRLNHTID